MTRRPLALAALAVAIAPAASAQEPPVARADTIAVHRLDALIVTAERAATSVETSTHAVSVLGAVELRRRPVRTLADALGQAPGLTFVDFDGSGDDPQLMTRGFYGGGESEYVLLLVDGRPINALESGRIAWDRVPLAAIERVEVVRGPGSAAWGDAAIGGVLNIVTSHGGAASRAAISGGADERFDAEFSMAGSWAGRPVSVFGGYDRTDGFRDHSERGTGGFGARVALVSAPDRLLELSMLSDWRRFDEPGPLTAEAIEESRTAVAPFYRFDRTEDRLHRLALDAAAGAADGAGARITGSLAAELRHSDRTRTVPLAPTFADTKARVLDTNRLLASVQLALPSPLTDGRDALTIGVDAHAGGIDSEYFAVAGGSPEDYAASSGERGERTAGGSGARTAAAGFASYTIDATNEVRLTLGARVNWLRDTFEPDEGSAIGADADASHTAFSPRAGLNVRYIGSQRHEGHAYVNVARTFKAPTPDQLFDQRTFPVPFPPFEVGFANADLEPQYGTSYEAGIYHRALLGDAVAAALTVSAYRIDLRDELDFDLQTLSYQNIGESRHSGIEAGLDLRGMGPFGAFVRYTLQDATSRIGENAGNQLKAIPKHVIAAGADAAAGPLSASLIVTSASGIWLDDANTVALPDWTRWDARAGYDAGIAELFVELRNLFDAEYSTTGFPDSADPSTIYYHPAAGRTLTVGLSRAW